MLTAKLQLGFRFLTTSEEGGSHEMDEVMFLRVLAVVVISEVTSYLMLIIARVIGEPFDRVNFSNQTRIYIMLCLVLMIIDDLDKLKKRLTPPTGSDKDDDERRPQ